MKYKKIILCMCAVFIVSSICTGCTNQKKEPKQVNKNIILNQGAIVENNKGQYVNYNYTSDTYGLINSKESISCYDYESGNYIGQIGGKYIASFNGKINGMDEVGIYDSYFNISPKGKYVSFFRNQDGSELKVISLKTGDYININKKVSISGKYVDWLNENTLIYYGIRDSDKKNGIFTYNVDTKQESLFIGLSEGYIEFIKVLDNGVVYSQGFFDSDKKLIVSSLNGSDINIVSSDIKKLYDIEEVNGVYYVLGSFKNEDEGLYSIEKNVERRLTYSFPSYVVVKKGLVKTENGEILFIGCNNNDKNLNIYKCAQDGAVSLIRTGSEEISFVKRYINQNS